MDIIYLVFHPYVFNIYFDVNYTSESIYMIHAISFFKQLLNYFSIFPSLIKAQSSLQNLFHQDFQRIQ